MSRTRTSRAAEATGHPEKHLVPACRKCKAETGGDSIQASWMATCIMA